MPETSERLWILLKEREPYQAVFGQDYLITQFFQNILGGNSHDVLVFDNKDSTASVNHLWRSRQAASSLVNGKKNE